jgi:hypothetical protein
MRKGKQTDRQTDRQTPKQTGRSVPRRNLANIRNIRGGSGSSPGPRHELSAVCLLFGSAVRWCPVRGKPQSRALRSSPRFLLPLLSIMLPRRRGPQYLCGARARPNLSLCTAMRCDGCGAISNALPGPDGSRTRTHRHAHSTGSGTPRRRWPAALPSPFHGCSGTGIGTGTVPACGR